MAPQLIEHKSPHFVTGPFPLAHPSDLLSPSPPLAHLLLPTVPWQGLSSTEGPPPRRPHQGFCSAVTGPLSLPGHPIPAHSFLGPCSHFLQSTYTIRHLKYLLFFFCLLVGFPLLGSLQCLRAYSSTRLIAKRLPNDPPAGGLTLPRKALGLLGLCIW